MHAVEHYGLLFSVSTASKATFGQFVESTQFP